MSASGAPVGRVVSIWRYPVKSMLGEELDNSSVTERGFAGDRQWALADDETGKIASAKNPRRWPRLFEFSAAYARPLSEHDPLPPVRITLPGGDVLTTDDPDASQRLSAALDRTVRLVQVSHGEQSAEGYWPNEPWLDEPDTVFEFTFPTGTFFDGAPVHLLTTATLDELRTRSPSSRFEPPRFRPNLVIEPHAGERGFVEQAWLGRHLAVGSAVLKVERPCPRCVMTTLPQGSLEKDPRILRTAVEANAGNVGVYAHVVSAGTVRRGDDVRLV